VHMAIEPRDSTAGQYKTKSGLPATAIQSRTPRASPPKLVSSRRSARPEVGSPKVRASLPRFANGFSRGFSGRPPCALLRTSGRCTPPVRPAG
jgi:hypothetical protein